MFGTNKLEKRTSDPDWIEYRAIFPTIQGEGPFAGEPCVFIRLSGCNLRCHFCDTNFEGGSRVAVRNVADTIMNCMPNRKNKLVVITGGEPFRQDFSTLAKLLMGMHQCRVQVETAGTLWQPNVVELFTAAQFWGKFSVVCSPKTGMVVPEIASFCSHWKYIIADGMIDLSDGLPVMATQRGGQSVRLFRPPREDDTVWLQPMEEYNVTYNKAELPSPDPLAELADQKVTGALRDEEKSRRNVELCGQLAMQHGYRVSLQLHKYLGLP